MQNDEFFHGMLSKWSYFASMKKTNVYLGDC